MKDFEVDHLISIIPNLEILSFHIHDDNCFLKAIVNYLTNPNLTKSIKELNLQSYDDFNVLSSVFQTKHLKLEKFTWSCMKNMDCVSDVENFLSNQINLKVLELLLTETNLFNTIAKICSKINLEQLLFYVYIEIIIKGDDSKIFVEF